MLGMIVLHICTQLKQGAPRFFSSFQMRVFLRFYGTTGREGILKKLDVVLGSKTHTATGFSMLTLPTKAMPLRHYYVVYVVMS